MRICNKQWSLEGPRESCLLAGKLERRVGTALAAQKGAEQEDAHSSASACSWRATLMRLATQLLARTAITKRAPPPAGVSVRQRRSYRYSACARMSAQQAQAEGATAGAQTQQKAKKPAIAKEAFFVYSGPPPVRQASVGRQRAEPAQRR